MSDKINVLHIDNQLSEIVSFKLIIDQFPELNYCGGFDNTETCYDFINLSNNFYIVFMDIYFSGKSGLWLAEKLSKTNTGIIFLTNESEYAHAAFKVNALDFILKPISLQILHNTLEKIIDKGMKMIQLIPGEKTDTFASLPAARPPEKLFLQMVGSIEIILLKEVVYIISHGNYSEFILTDQTHVISSKGIKVYEELLVNHPDFLRIHKSYIVNKQHIKSISKKQRSYKAIMINKEELEMSYQRKDELLNLIME